MSEFRCQNTTTVCVNLVVETKVVFCQYTECYMADSYQQPIEEEIEIQRFYEVPFMQFVHMLDFAEIKCDIRHMMARTARFDIAIARKMTATLTLTCDEWLLASTTEVAVPLTQAG